MPILKHAIKKQRVDERRSDRNKVVRTAAKSAVKTVRAQVDLESLKQAFSAVDKAAKKGVFHQRKANRLKSRLSKLLSKPAKEVVVKKPLGKVKKTAKKKA